MSSLPVLLLIAGLLIGVVGGFMGVLLTFESSTDEIQARLVSSKDSLSEASLALSNLRTEIDSSRSKISDLDGELTEALGMISGLKGVDIEKDRVIAKLNEIMKTVSGRATMKVSQDNILGGSPPLTVFARLQVMVDSNEEGWYGFGVYYTGSKSGEDPLRHSTLLFFEINELRQTGDTVIMNGRVFDVIFGSQELYSFGTPITITGIDSGDGKEEIIIIQFAESSPLTLQGEVTIQT